MLRIRTVLKTSLLCFVFAAAPLSAQQKVIPIWPGTPPGSGNETYEEGEYTRQQDGVKRITNITRPTLTVYLPDPARATGTGVIICPGGGFRWLAIDKEGTALAQWL